MKGARRFIDVEGTLVTLWGGHIIGSLVNSRGALSYPERTCVALLPRLRAIDVENTLDTASSAGNIKGPDAQFSPAFLFMIARIVRSMPCIARPKPGWWQILVHEPVLLESLLACADHFDAPEYPRLWLRYETVRRLVAAEELRLRLPQPVTP
jgi:hypothetical protein